jgi:hypothetical protein
MYLKNDLCNFTPLFDIDYTKKKNIISVSLFKMYTGGYKNFNKYIIGLFNLVKTIKNNYKQFIVRLFIDNSIYNDVKLFNKIKKLKVDIIIYSCPNYLLNNKYHYGLFGTLVRFFPMFDFENNDANLVIIQDSDFIKKKLDELFIIINKLDLYNKYKNYYILKSSNISSIFDDHDVFYKNILNSYTVAPGFISINRIKNNVLIEYIKSVKNNIFSYFYDQKNKINNKTNKFINTHNFVYGVDEYFLNNHLIKYIIDNKLKFININSFDLFTRIYRYFKYYDENNKKNSYMDNLLNLLLDKLKINYNNLSTLDKYKIIDNLINKSETVYKLLYKIFLLFYKKKTYNFLYPDNLYKIILTNKYFGMYQFEIIIFEFDKIPDIFINKKKIDDKYLQNLYSYLERCVF